MTPDEIRAAQKALGLSQAKLAQVMGLRGQAAISEWLTGKHEPTGPAVRLLRAYLDGYRPRDWPTSTPAPARTLDAQSSP